MTRWKRCHFASDLGHPQPCSDGSSQGCLPRAPRWRVPGQPGQTAASPTGSLQVHKMSCAGSQGEVRAGEGPRRGTRKIKLLICGFSTRKAGAGRNSSGCSFCSEPAPLPPMQAGQCEWGGGQSGQREPSTRGRAFLWGQDRPPPPPPRLSVPIVPSGLSKVSEPRRGCFLSKMTNQKHFSFPQRILSPIL